MDGFVDLSVGYRPLAIMVTAEGIGVSAIWDPQHVGSPQLGLDVGDRMPPGLDLLVAAITWNRVNNTSELIG